MVVEPTQLEEEPPVEQQTAGKESILSERKVGSAEEKRPPQSKESATAEETKVASSPAVEKQEAEVPNKNETSMD